MEKMKLETRDLALENIEKLEDLFPNVVTESEDEYGNKVKTVDLDKIKILFNIPSEVNKESYDLTWVGKNEAIIEANRTIRKTLRPKIGKSKNWNETQNIYIEGDNLDALKLLQESYLNKIKLIYIDPPYNTGNDILYKNNYYESESEYMFEEQFDPDGNSLFVNTDANGRFHSDWCSMMYSRISLARNLLTEDGFFAVAIDHNELFNLGEICDEIFGFHNRIGIISVVHKPEGRNQAKFIGPSNEFMLIYAKDSSKAKIRKVALDDDQLDLFNMSDDIGRYYLKNFIRLADGKYATREAKPDFWYPIYVSDDLKTVSTTQIENGNIVYPITNTGIERTWKTTKATCEERIQNGDLVAKYEDNRILIYEKLRESQVIKTHWINKKYHGYHFGTKILDDLLGVKTFDFPKSVYLMHDIIKLFTESDDIILDFFSGSATTAHALMQLNSEDGHHRRFILVQIPAACNKNSPAYKAGYTNICEIGEERIRKSGEKIVGSSFDRKTDVGFRVFSISSSNAKNIYYSPENYQQDLLSMSESNIKEDRTDLDLLFGCLLDWGLELSKPYKSEEIAGVAVHTYNEDALVACFAENIPEKVVREIAERQPLRAVFRDSSFGDDASRVNLGEIFKLLSPDTEVKVL